MTGLLMVGVAPSVLAGVGNFKLSHSSGPCTDCTLYGLGADLATDATGAEIYEWIDGNGRTTNYPNAPIVMGSKAPKGYVVIATKANDEHGTGNRSVTVKWADGNETIPLKIVATCEELRGAPCRTAPPPNPPFTYCKEDPNPSTPDPCN